MVYFSDIARVKMTIVILTATAALVAFVFLTGSLGSRSAHANDIEPFETVYATDVGQFGYGGMRTIGTGTVTVSGVTGTVTRALLYWHGPTNSEDPAANAAVNFNGTDVTGSNIGLSSDNCWGFTNSQAYRSDVTSLVTGDGAYTLAAFTKADSEINGVSLLVFFDDGNDANNRDVVLFNGNDSNVTDNGFDADGWNVNLPGINYTSGTASMDLHVGDGQSFDDADVILNGVTTLAAAPAVFQGDSVPNGASAVDTDGGLWDIKSYDVTASMAPGINTLTLTSAYTDDCLSLVVAAVNLPAGAAPGQPSPTASPTPTPAPTPAPTPTPTSAPAALPNTGGEPGSGPRLPWPALTLGVAAACGAAWIASRRYAR